MTNDQRGEAVAAQQIVNTIDPMASAAAPVHGSGRLRFYRPPVMLDVLQMFNLRTDAKILRGLAIGHAVGA